MKDVLSDILETIRLQETLYFRTDFSPPWAIEVPAYKTAARFHLVIQGRCHVKLPSGRTVALQAGDLALIPHGRAHILSDRDDRAPNSLERVLEEAGYSGDGVFILGKGDPEAATRMLCGHFGFAEGADHPIMRAMPELVVLTNDDRPQHPFLDGALRLLEKRVFSDGVGAKAAVTKLSELLLIEAIRAIVSQSPHLKQIMAAITDTHVGRALALLHEAYAKDWTVENLAESVGMSRSRFAERFCELLGEGPMHYLAEWRLQRAMYLLSQPRISVQEVALQVGYQSTSAFSRAFTAKFGAAPTAFKRV
jgi:AraC-like DNA-binding protein